MEATIYEVNGNRETAAQQLREQRELGVLFIIYQASGERGTVRLYIFND